jgi:light-regulated signal transduction histidine kinase (bacteriophytochrome)
MFQRLKSRDEVEGSGMGLAIIKKIIEEQEGSIWIEYTSGTRGATFRFTWRKAGAGMGGGNSGACRGQHSAR